MKEPAAALTKDLAAAGFLCLGGFAPGEDAGVPPLSNGQRAGTLLLISSTGPSLWPAFSKSPEQSDGRPDPLDRFTRRVLTGSASAHGFEPLFPFEGPPYYPFQQWALRCGGFSQSPLGVLAHRAYGPWAGFRAAFLSAGKLAATSSSLPVGPCESCTDKPCVSVCPVSAISLESGYDVAACRTYLAQSPDRDCWSGCLARRACPFGTQHRQSTATAGFHMKSFAG